MPYLSTLRRLRLMQLRARSDFRPAFLLFDILVQFMAIAPVAVPTQNVNPRIQVLQGDCLLMCPRLLNQLHNPLWLPCPTVLSDKGLQNLDTQLGVWLRRNVLVVGLKDDFRILQAAVFEQQEDGLAERLGQRDRPLPYQRVQDLRPGMRDALDAQELEENGLAHAGRFVPFLESKSRSSVWPDPSRSEQQCLQNTGNSSPEDVMSLQQMMQKLM
jgi:hypothetical protein